MTYSRSSRRALLKSLTAAGGAVLTARSVPAAWVRPVVDSVSLPVHAATSPAYLPSAGPAEIVLSAWHGNGNRFTALVDALIPAAEAVISIDINIYVCVKPSANGTRADVTVYEGLDPCSPTSAPTIIRHIGSGLKVPSTGNALAPQEDICAATGIQDLLERLQIVKNAFADGTIIMDIKSVENGAKGMVHVGPQDYKFDVPPGACSPPPCCV